MADEILRAGGERAQLVVRLGGDHEHRKIAVRFDFLEAFHHLEAVHAGHQQIEQDQVVAILAIQLADRMGICRRRNVHIAVSTQHLLQQLHIGFLIVNDQNAGIKDFFFAYHRISLVSFFWFHFCGVSLLLTDPVPEIFLVSANFSASSNALMNSSTMIGLVI